MKPLYRRATPVVPLCMLLTVSCAERIPTLDVGDAGRPRPVTGPALPAAEFTVTASLDGHAPDEMATGIPWREIVVPAPGWVRVSVEGGITLEANPAYESLCRANFWSPCPPRYLGPVGPDGVDVGTPGRPLTVVVRTDGERFAYEHRFPAYGATVYTYVERRGTLRVMRTSFPAGRTCLSEPYCGGVPAEPVIWEGSYPFYRVTGAQTVRVEAVPHPLRVDGPARVDPGAAAVFTATGEIPIRPSSYRWFFIPGDTAVAPRNPGDLGSGGIFMFGCYEATCSYTPAAAGRMYATAIPDAPHAGVEARAASVVVRVGACAVGSPAGASGDGSGAEECEAEQTPALRLSCNPAQVERGQQVTCTAEASPANARVEDVEWMFEGSGFTIRPGQWTGNEAYVEAQRRSLTWRGVLLVSGRVSVSALVNGTRTAATPVEVPVTPRPWTQRPLPEITWHRGERCTTRMNGECILDYPPEEVSDFGSTVIPFGRRGLTWEVVQSGPNEGLYVLGGDEALYFVTGIHVYLNAVLDDPRDRYWRTTPCTVSDVRNHVEQHELAHVAIARRNLMEERAIVHSNETYVRLAPRPQRDPEWRAALQAEVYDYLSEMDKWVAVIGDRDHHARDAYPLQLAFPCDPNLKRSY